MLLNTVALAISDIASKTLRNELSSGFIVFIYKFWASYYHTSLGFEQGSEVFKNKENILPYSEKSFRPQLQLYALYRD